MQDVDEEFYKRADAHIHLANSQVSEKFISGKVSASFMFALTRFNSWICATGAPSKEELLKAKEENIEYFVTQYRNMLEENMDDYITNFDKYMKVK